jgi:hypothetical protein
MRVSEGLPVRAQARIQVFFLPSHRCEFDSDERLNAGPRKFLGSKVPARTKAGLHFAADGHVQS